MIVARQGSPFSGLLVREDTGVAERRRADLLGDIWVMNADGSIRVNLTNHPAVDVLPAWLPRLVASPSLVASP